MDKRITTLAAVIGVILVFFAAIDVAHGGPPKVGGVLSDLELVIAKDSADLQYLGIPSDNNVFKISQIRSRVVIIEVFSMYCPYCQAEAPNINKLNQLIENNPAFKNKIKIIGIGAGNTPFEVGTFKRKYSIQFPLFPDDNFRLYKILGETRTPYFIVVKLNGNNLPEVLYSKLGAIENIDLFLSQIAKLSGLQ